MLLDAQSNNPCIESPDEKSIFNTNFFPNNLFNSETIRWSLSCMMNLDSVSKDFDDLISAIKTLYRFSIIK